MATAREVRQLVRALRFDSADQRELAQGFLRYKIEAYVDTQLELAEQLGYQLDDDQLELSDEVIRALTDEANRNAQHVVDTYNADVEKVVLRNQDRDARELVDVVAAWSSDRADMRADMIATSEAYPAHADARLAFFIDNGLDPTWHFGGHPDEGDAPAACKVCQALEHGGPYTTLQVLSIGTPHIACAQQWHPDVDPEQLPDSLVLGQAVAGIVGQEALVNRSGNDHDEAVAAIQNLTGGSTQ